MSDKILNEAYARLTAIEEATSPEEEQINVLTLRMRQATEDDDEAAYHRAVDALNALTDKMNAEQVHEDIDPEVLHDAAIDMLDDMLDALPEDDHYGPKGDVIRYVMGRLQEVGLGR